MQKSRPHHFPKPDNGTLQVPSIITYAPFLHACIHATSCSSHISSFSPPFFPFMIRPLSVHSQPAGHISIVVPHVLLLVSIHILPISSCPDRPGFPSSPTRGGQAKQSVGGCCSSRVSDHWRRGDRPSGSPLGNSLSTATHVHGYRGAASLGTDYTTTDMPKLLVTWKQATLTAQICPVRKLGGHVTGKAAKSVT